jgi:RNA polymerase sigma factor (sigma-70 family)
MASDDRGAGGRFATTRWSLVLAAGRPGGRRSAQALASLCEIYWPPVYSFVRHQGYSADEARDLTQEFFARVLEKNYFHDADPNRGKFRSFLAVSVRHFLSNERDRARALKRGGPHPPVSLDLESAEGHYQIEPRDELTPERLFDYQWALVLLRRVLARLRDEHESAGRLPVFDGLKGLLTGDADDLSYKDIARTLGMTEGAVKVAVHRMRKRYRELLMDEIAETVATPDEIESEIQYLRKALSL